MIKEYIFEKEISLPAKIQIKLRGRIFRIQFDDNADIPSLEKIQNYIKYLKKN